MKNTILFFLFITLLFSCEKNQTQTNLVVNTDIENFWTAYDAITKTADTLEQSKLLQKLYLDQGSPGLAGMIEAKRYTQADFLNAINNYPKFWASIRENTLRSKLLEKDLMKGIEKLRDIYPSLRPAKIYFTIGALRSNGTTQDSLVLIGSELAMSDKNTDASEFPKEYRAARQTYFNSNPIDNVVLLNVHEYVHTQQNEIPPDLLGRCLYEGVAEFVSVTAMEVPSSAPAINFGKANEAAVKAKFEKDVFLRNKTYQWLWGDEENGFGVRDLGYYVGYEISERFYQSSENKKEAIASLIALDFSDEQAIEAFIDETKYFTKPIAQLREEFEERRPMVTKISELQNNATNINPNQKRITIHFSMPMNKQTRGFDYGPLGADNVLSVQKIIGFSEDGMSFAFEVELKPNRQYQSTVSSNFLSKEGAPLKPFLIDFKTRNN